MAFESALVFLVSGYISLAIAKAAGADIMLATSKWLAGTFSKNNHLKQIFEKQ